jgi:hypothetical protein
MIWLEAWARVVVVLHAAAAIVLIGAATHHAIVAFGYLRGVHRVRLARIYGATVLGAYAVCFALGAIAYPTYRYRVRGLYLDWYEVWASNLFDIKENFAALGFPAVVVVFVLGRALKPKDEPALVPCYVALVVFGALLVWFNVFSGLAITLAKGV